jgi:hypothetical protein
MANRERTLRMARLHMDATRSGSLFAEHLVLVEGVTDAVVLRQLGAVWADGDTLKQGFIDALTITVIGTKVGSWPVELLATSGYEIVRQLAILRDSDTRGASPPALPAWITSRAPVVKAFVGHPTLEPSLVESNEDAVAAALTTMGITLTAGVSVVSVDTAFGDTYKKRKGEFALELAGEFAARHAAGSRSTFRSTSASCSNSCTPNLPGRMPSVHPARRTASMRLQLTDEQKRAAATPAQRAYIEAGPGCGKTTVAAERYGVLRFDGCGHAPGLVALSFAR